MGLRMIVAAAAICGAAAAAAQDADEGEALYQDTCRSCHGPEAGGMASFPKLAGREEDYLVRRLEQYRAGERVGANSALMQPVAADLSDAEIANLAAYIATFE